MNECTRVLVRDVPPMLRDIVRRLVANQPDMTLLQADAGSSGSLESWRQPEPDVVVLSTHDIERDGNVAESFSRWPRARVLVIEISGQHTMLYELRPHVTALGELSPEQLADSIRGTRVR